jgi:formylglycine-generating enzyme required for sulfatase activity
MAVSRSAGITSQLRGSHWKTRVRMPVGAGSCLPHEWEWQYAAQGADGRIYPWGNSWNPEAVPTPDKGRTMRSPDAVDAHPQGTSPFGVIDLVENV